MAFRFFHKKQNWSKGIYGSLISFLISQLSSPEKAPSIVDEAKNFLSLPVETQHRELIRIILLFENYCCNLDEVQRMETKEFRRLIITAYPEIEKNLHCRILFINTRAAVQLISAFFLLRVLEPIREITGTRKGNPGNLFFEWATDIWMGNKSEFPSLGENETLESEENVIEVGRQVYQHLSRYFGAQNLERLYHKAYDKTSYLYRDYPHFSSLLALMPASILKPEQLRILGKTQMKEILYQQLREMESLNQRLVEQISHNEKLNRDLSERTHALENIISNALDAIITIDADARIIHWNKQAEETFGHTALEVTGKYMFDIIIPPELRSAHKKGMQRYLTTRESRILNTLMEVEAIRKNGEQFPVELNISEFKDKGRLFFVGHIKDISERKKYEASLIKAREEAEETSRFKSRFFANMSHEIRTPLNAIIGFTDLLQKQDTTEEQEEYLGLIETSGKNLMSLLNDILEISKIEEGKIHLNPKTEIFTDVILEILSPYEILANEKGLKFEISFEEAFPKKISMDYHRYGQILINLVSNALKFTNEGGIKIRFGYRFEQKGAFTVSCTVSDSGKGIKEKNLDSIFDSFKQENEEIHKNFGGTGLGLSISKEIAELMNGSIKAISPSRYFKDKGTDFILQVSASLTYVGEEVSRKKLVSSSNEPLNFNALLAEDNPINQKLLSRVLNDMGLQITLVNNGLEATRILEKEKFDIVFMDLQMPEMDGYQASEYIRNKLNLDVPIIAISANVYPEDIEKSLKAGMQAHVGKPFKTNELRHTIESLLIPSSEG